VSPTLARELSGAGFEGSCCRIEFEDGDVVVGVTETWWSA